MRQILITIMINAFLHAQIPDNYDDYDLAKEKVKPIKQNSLSVLFDKTAPTILSMKVKTDNIEHQWATTGDLVTIFCEASETVHDIRIIVLEKEIEIKRMNAREFIANYLIVDDDPDGLLPFNVSFKDSAGNTLENYEITTDGSSVTVDRTKPDAYTTGIMTPVGGNALPNVWNSTNNSMEAVIPVPNDTTLIGGVATFFAKIGSGEWEMLGISHPLDANDLDSLKKVVLTEDMVEAVSGFDNGLTIEFRSSLIDKVGNETIGEMSESKIIIDQTLPTLSRIDVESTNLFPSVAKVGDTVKIKFIADEPIEPPKFTIYGNEIDAVNTEHFNWMVEYVIKQEDSEGYVRFNYQPIVDVNGNPEKKETITQVTGFTGDTTIVYQNGDMFSGNWKEGIIDGYGTFSWKNVGNYKGRWMNGKRNGYGTMVYNSGSRYEGEWKDGDFHGDGTYYYANGDVYNGEWRNGLKYGQGTYEWKSGNSYRGAWINDHYTNKGIMTFSNGEKWGVYVLPK